MLGGSIPMLESILYTLLGLIIGGALGFYFTKKKFEKELRENPPINEKMIRALGVNTDHMKLVISSRGCELPRILFLLSK